MNGFKTELKNASANKDLSTSFPPQDFPMAFSKLHVEKGSQHNRNAITVLKAIRKKLSYKEEN